MYIMTIIKLHLIGNGLYIINGFLVPLPKQITFFLINNTVKYSYSKVPELSNVR